LVIGACVGALGLFMAGWALYLAWGAASFVERSLPAEGRVLAHDGNLPIVEFQADGRKRTFRSNVSGAPRFRVGERVEVFYDPSHPSDARLAAATYPRTGALGLGGLGVLFASIGLYQVIRAAQARRVGDHHWAPNRLPGLQSVPPPPRRPSRRALHLISGDRGRRGVVRQVGIGFTVVGLGLSILFCWGLPVDAAIALGRSETTATIVTTEANRSVTMNGRHPTRVRFEFQADGASWSGQADTMDIAPGQVGSVAVEYASTNPGWSRIAGGTYSLYGYLGLFICLFPALGIAILWNVARARRRTLRAFTRGRPVLARVTFRGSDESTFHGEQYLAMLRWEFRTPAGARHEGSLTARTPQDLGALAGADQVVVLYDPDDPACNTLYVP
jgi:hypothetical protein